MEQQLSFVDVHAHLTDDLFASDLPKVLKAARDAGINFEAIQLNISKHFSCLKGLFE